jgi:hypothetical protein
VGFGSEANKWDKGKLARRASIAKRKDKTLVMLNSVIGVTGSGEAAKTGD